MSFSDTRSYPPSLSGSSKNSVNNTPKKSEPIDGSVIDMLQALRDLPTSYQQRNDSASDDIGGGGGTGSSYAPSNSSSPPPSGTASSFEIEKPLLHGHRHSFAHSMAYSLSDYGASTKSSSRELSLASSRRGSSPGPHRTGPSTPLNSSQHRPPPLDFGNFRPTAKPFPFIVQEEVSPKTTPTGSKTVQTPESVPPTSTSSPSFSLFKRKTASSPHNSLALPKMPVSSGSTPLLGTIPAPYLPRSTIPMNPFGSIRRKLALSRGDQHRLENQLVAELLITLEEYADAFGASSSSLPVPPPATPAAFNPMSFDAAARERLGKLQVSRASLESIIGELDSLVEELSEHLPNFKNALLQGAYGPFTVSKTDLSTSRADAFRAYEPESWQEVASGQFWPLRMKRDLGTDFTLLDSDTPVSLAVPENRPTLSTSPSLQQGDFESPLSNSMQRVDTNDSQRSVELLQQGKERWNSYINKKR